LVSAVLSAVVVALELSPMSLEAVAAPPAVVLDPEPEFAAPDVAAPELCAEVVLGPATVPSLPPLVPPPLALVAVASAASSLPPPEQARRAPSAAATLAARP
jgi:hypothetical protein